MEPTRDERGNVAAWCDRCGSRVTYESNISGSRWGSIGWNELAARDGSPYFLRYDLLRCSGCGRGAVAEVITTPEVGYREHPDESKARLVTLSPTSIEAVPLPALTPEPIVQEVREAERCARAGAFRGASAMLRSALEKVLNTNGYAERTLYLKVEAAAEDGVLTESRRRQAHDNVRSLGNDVVHEDWRPVDQAEYELSYRYTQRIIEDFYESRDALVPVLVEKGRLEPEPDDPPVEA